MNFTEEKLNEILKKHNDWLNRKEGGERACLRGANIRGAILYGANLRGAILYRADLSWSNFIYKIGEIVEEPNFCTDRFTECAPGIHFFINRDEAVMY